MGIRDRIFNWLRAFLGIDHLTAEVRLNEQAHTREIAFLNKEVSRLTAENVFLVQEKALIDKDIAALKKAAERPAHRQAPTDFESAQIIALESFNKEND